jgi:hypothetical protein
VERSLIVLNRDELTQAVKNHVSQFLKGGVGIILCNKVGEYGLNGSPLEYGLALELTPTTEGQILGRLVEHNQPLNIPRLVSNTGVIPPEQLEEVLDKLWKSVVAGQIVDEV